MDDVDYIYKILLIGDSSVGKTCLSNRFTRNEFTFRTIHTIGVDFSVVTLQVDGRSVKAQIWDTAGQEKYRAITNAYYRNAAGALLVFDVTQRTSFESLPRWLKDLRDHAAEGTRVVIVGNKADLAAHRDVSIDEAREYCIKHGCSYLETSAKESCNVQEAFHLLVQDIYNQNHSAGKATGKQGALHSATIHVDARGRRIDVAAAAGSGQVINGSWLLWGQRRPHGEKNRMSRC